MHVASGLLAGLARWQETAAIFLVAEDVFAAIAAVHRMIDRAGVFDAQMTWHQGKFSSSLTPSRKKCKK